MTQLSACIGNLVRWAQTPFARKMTTLLVLALQLTFPMTMEAIADDTSGFKSVAGISVYIGLMPAEIVRGHPSGHPEPQMHGGAPNGPHAYHVVVALFDEQNGANRIEDASIAATVSGVGQVGQTNVTLEPMLIADTVTYGAFIDLRALERFEIALTITVPNRPGPVRVDFENQHLP